METLIAHSQLVDSLRSRIDAQAKALSEIADILAEEAERCRRADQARCIDTLQDHVLWQVRRLQRAEESARMDFTMARPGRSIAMAVGTGLGAWLSRNADPFCRAMEVLKKEMDKTLPFGNVVVMVGPRAIPQRLEVILLSRMARESSRSESETVAALEAKGYRLGKPEILLAQLDKLREQVLSGAVVLPITEGQVRACLAPPTPEVHRVNAASAMPLDIARPRRLLPLPQSPESKLPGSSFCPSQGVEIAILETPKHKSSTI
ncbi:MAG: hypothetical protein JW753_01205 [Dehalococcoidia bacterium]|nr:hypothetical protein [Dehalococcoidia bacterium]